MRKYAAATALTIALNITMLTPAVSGGAVSASLTPANARFTPFCGPPRTHSGINGMGKCETELWYTAKLWDRTRNPPYISCPPVLQACITTCVKAVEAARR
jgi:hypothetical protein